MTSSCAELVGESVEEAIGGAIIEGVLDAALDSAFEAGKAITSGNNQKTPAEPEDPFCSKDIFFISPVDGLVTDNKEIFFEFGEYNISINPAGELPPKNEHSCYVSGHHHLIVNAAYEPTLNGSIPFKENIHHFGGGQKTATIPLEPGKYSLQLVLGDYMHSPVAIGISEENFIVSKKIFIEVTE